MKQILAGVITLMLLVLYGDHVPGFLTLFGLLYFVWAMIGIAWIDAGLKELKADHATAEDEQWESWAAKELRQ